MLGLLAALGAPRCVAAQPVTPSITPIETISLAVGRSFPLDLTAAVTQVTVANPEVADVVVLNERSVVINAKSAGETDVLLSGATLGRRHLRISVYSAVERRQIALAVKFAEVRRSTILEMGVSATGTNRSGDGSQTGGTGVLGPSVSGAPPSTSSVASRFLSGIATWTTGDISAYITAQEQRGNARSLAEPTLLAGNRDSASFLAGGEIPIPIAQPSANGQINITIAYRPFGIKLNFIGEVLSDSLIKLHVEPEVSTLDYANALLLSGFRIPALRTRRVGTTVDVRPGQSLILSGLFNEERENVREGIPGLMNIPILGALFSSSRWQKQESELLIIVTPELFDPNFPRSRDVIPLLPETRIPPASEAIQKRLPPPDAAPQRPNTPPPGV
ncbi:MAG: pilus assembly protein N-terminal domain-containing protein [Gemmatimonadaceae bacterium]|nr:pilus assembly protein N-terminal domain-containing protein [Gemmatimonadaceae bacterium]